VTTYLAILKKSLSYYEGTYHFSYRIDSYRRIGLRPPTSQRRIRVLARFQNLLYTLDQIPKRTRLAPEIYRSTMILRIELR